MRITLIILCFISVFIVLTTGFWGAVSSSVFANSSWGLYDRNFFENLLVEMHGSIFDLLVVGVILYWFEKRRDNQEKLSRAKEDLDSLKYYYGKDSSFKFYSALRYLLSLGVNKADIPEANLNNLKIDALHLSSSNLIATNFNKSILSNVVFDECNMEAANFIDSELKSTSFKKVNLKRAKFINAKLKGIDFRSCDIKGAVFNKADLKSANFRGVDCSQVNFEGADLRSANFLETTNLTRAMLDEADNYRDAKLPSEILTGGESNTPST